MFKKFLNYAIPSIIGMLITSLYLVIDGVFVSKGVGEIGVAAVTLVFPLTTGFTSLSMIFAVGGANLVSINFGKNNIKKGNDIFRQSIYSLLFIGTILCLLGVVFSNGIVNALGATPDLRKPALEYYTYYILFSIPILLSMTLSTFIRNDGSPKLSMYSMILGAITNIILDYVFVFPLEMGLKGAAIATGLGQLVSVLVCLFHFTKKSAKLSFGTVKFRFNDLKDIFVIGLPSFLVEICYSIIMYFYNLTIIKYIGDLGVTAYGVVNYITNLSYMALFGVSQAIQPLISYHYGSGEFEKCKGYFKLGSIFSLVISIILFVFYLPFGKNVISIFSNTKEVMDLSYTILTYTNLAYIPLGLNMIIITFYQSICLPKYSNIFCFLRGFLLIKLFLIILPPILGERGIWISMLFSEGGTYLISIFILKKKLKESLSVSTPNISS